MQHAADPEDEKTKDVARLLFDMCLMESGEQGMRVMESDEQGMYVMETDEQGKPGARSSGIGRRWSDHPGSLWKDSLSKPGGGACHITLPSWPAVRLAVAWVYSLCKPGAAPLVLGVHVMGDCQMW